MFVTQAHSFKQQARLAVTLAWVGGYTDIVTLLACGTVTSHVSGTASNMGRDFFEGSWRLAGYALFLLGAFFVGAAVSGFSTDLGRRRGWESIYVLPIFIEAILLAVFAAALNRQWHSVNFAARFYWMPGLASAAMGLQNATITSISSGQVRTTHVTGVLTDLGHEGIQFLWWRIDQRNLVPPGSAPGAARQAYSHPTGRRLALLAAIIATFALGGGLGGFAFMHAPRWSMFPPVGFLLWIIFQDVYRPIAEIEPSALVNAEQGLDLPAALAVFHLRKDHDRAGRVHRMPNLLAWSERLAAITQVVVLDLGEVTELDANAALELRALLARFATQHRSLVIAGVDQQRFQQINASGMGDALSSDNICPDLELAIARALNLLESSGS